jgi:hypothetical protein
MRGSEKGKKSRILYFSEGFTVKELAGLQVLLGTSSIGDGCFVIATSYRKLRTSRNIDKLDTGRFTMEKRISVFRTEVASEGRPRWVEVHGG